jgi:hypothetical protein
MGMNSALTAQDAEKRAVGAKALRFVFPEIAGQIRDEDVTPEAAALGVALARVIDVGSRTTYGIFKFYEAVYTGLLKGAFTWKDIPEAVIDAAKAGLEDRHTEMANPVTRALVSYFSGISSRNVKFHLNDPEAFPCPEFSIDPSNRLHRIIFRLDEFSAVK